MAATLTPDAQLTYYSFPISKTEEADDGSGDLIVWGKATDGTLDSDLQIVDPEWSAKALQEWYDTGGNVRVQHQAQRDPAGRGIDIVTSGDGTFVKSRVVEPVAVKLVKAGVLQDYSVGIMNPDIRRGDPKFKHLDPMGKAVNGVITGRDDGMSKIGELSLVDRGSNFGTRFQMLKAAADGSAEFTGELTAPDEVLAKVAAPAKPKTVTVELPKNMSLSVKPSDLAKLVTFKRKLTEQAAEPAAAKAAEPDETKAAVADDPELAAFKAAGAAEDAILGKDHRTFTAEQRREHASAGTALADGSYPMPDADAVRRAAILIRSKHGNWKAAAKLLARRVKALGIPNPLKKTPKGDAGKVAKAAEPDATKCMKCDGSGMMDGKPCPSCKKGKKAAKRAVRKALAPAVAKKKKTMCSACGAKQSMKHDCCTECGKPMPRPMPAVAKNHDFACLGCGHDPLDKGERHCPSCGRENPGYNPMADHKIPMNADKAAKERVTKRKKAKAGKKGNPFGDKQAPPFGAKDGEGDDPKDKKPPKAKKAAKPKTAKRKGKGKGRSPAAGVAGHDGDTMGLPAHREPDGAPVEEFEDDAKMQDGDERQEMAAAMRHKSLAAKGLSRDDALLHDLTCPAFSPQSVARAFPYATFAGIDDGLWRQKMLDDAATAPLEIAGRAVQMWQHATTLKGADADILSDLRIEHHEAFLSANKAFRDATPGPGSFPTPSHVTPGQFRRPYIDAGHAAPSPQHAAPHSFGVPEGQPSAEDYTRGHLTEGHAADSPQNDTPRHEPQPASMEPGKPDRIYYRGTMRDNARQAMTAMHDHISRVFPDVCPMSPELTGTQKPAPPVPAGVGGPAPRASRKARKAAAKKAAKAAARKRRRLEQQVLKGKITVKQARAKLGMKPKTRKPAAVVKAMAPAPAAPIVTPLDPEVIKAAIAEANAPLMERVAAQDKRLRKQAKALNAIASQPDTSMAPLRGVAMTKSSAAAVPQPDTVQGRAERAQDNLFRAFLDEWRNSPDPGAREAAWSELTKMTGIDMTKQT